MGTMQVRQTARGTFGLSEDGRPATDTRTWPSQAEAEAAGRQLAERRGWTFDVTLVQPTPQAIAHQAERDAATRQRDAGREREAVATAENHNRAERGAADPTISVAEIDGRQRVDRESGSLVVYRRFTVQRPGHRQHTVEVEVSCDTGTPQAETCDCEAFRYHGECAHINAVYHAGVLSCDWGN